MKTCFKCGQLKPLDEFYADSRMADGHLGKCKACTRADARANRAANLVARREHDRQREQTPERRAQKLEKERRHRQRHPEKEKARAAVKRALRSGKLIKQPCEVCGVTEVDAHHDDYSQRLKVRWLCRTHHAAVHGAAVLPF